MRRLVVAGNVDVEVRQNAIQRLHRAAVAGGVHRRAAAGLPDRREHLRQIGIEVRHQRVIADQHHTAAGEQRRDWPAGATCPSASARRRNGRNSARRWGRSARPWCWWRPSDASTAGCNRSLAFQPPPDHRAQVVAADVAESGRLHAQPGHGDARVADDAAGGRLRSARRGTAGRGRWERPSGTGRTRMSATHDPQSTQSKSLVMVTLDSTASRAMPLPQVATRR